MTTRSHIVVVTDSSADLPEAWVRDAGLYVVPQLIVWDEERLEEGREIDRETIYTYLQRGRSLHVGHPTPDDFRVMFRKMAPEVTGIVVVALSTFFNPTMVSAEVAAVTYRKVPAMAVNSQSVSMGLGFVALEAARAAAQAASIEEVVEAARQARERVHVLFVGGDWAALRRHQHVPRSALWRRAAGARPLITLVQGRPHTVGYVRARSMGRQVIDWLEARLSEPPRQVAVMHAQADHMAAELQAAVRHRWSLSEVPVVSLTPVVAVRLGLGTVGVALLE